MSTNTRTVTVIDNKLVAYFVCNRLDHNFKMFNILLPEPQKHVTIHLPTSKLCETAILPRTIKHMTSLAEFNQAYPEYFI